MVDFMKYTYTTCSYVHILFVLCLQKLLAYLPECQIWLYSKTILKETVPRDELI
jgi:hypothetical protein